MNLLSTKYPTTNYQHLINYNNIPNQINKIGIDINSLILNRLTSFLGDYGGYNGIFSLPLMCVNTNNNFGVTSEKLISSIDSSNVDYTFDASYSNRISTIELPFNITQKQKYIFHYKN